MSVLPGLAAHAAHLGGGNVRGLGVVMAAALAGEVVWRLWIARRGYDARGAATTLGVAAGNLAAGAISAVALGGVYALVWSLAPVRWPLDDWRTWAAGFVAVEFAYYWQHRLSHEVRWLWATHATHHSAEQLTLLSAIRLGWTNLISGGWLIFLPLIPAGFDPRLVLALLAFNLHYQFFLHTEAVGRLGPLEWVLNTPAHHRVHHACNAAYLDRNYGGVVIVFDRLFGTFAAERTDEPLRYGLAHRPGSYNAVVVALGEWRAMFADMARARSLRAALAVALGRP
ncbi:sterol desaturase family protein [Caulobacter sp. KR2-114]|uniref:sterol desaturase family protein n=1 Tax=Caulobacter sp. KR2-114 TaxID=3400912 RepID=UPI003C01E416